MLLSSLFSKTTAQSAPCESLNGETGGVGGAVKGVLQGLNNSSVCVLMMFWVTDLWEKTAVLLGHQFPCLLHWSPFFNDCDPSLWKNTALGGPNHPWPLKNGGVMLWDLCHPPIMLLVYPLHRQLIYTRLLSRRQAGGEEVFEQVDGCQWWFESELTGSGSLRVTRGRMWSVIQSVECMSSGGRAAHLITSPKDGLREFLPEVRCTVRVIALAELICERMVNHSLQIQAKGWEWGWGAGV